MRRPAAFALICSMLASCQSEAPSRPRDADGWVTGEVDLARARTFLLRNAGGIEVLSLERGASRIGFSNLMELHVGERVRARVVREVARVKIVDEVEVEGVASADAQWTIDVPIAHQLLSRFGTGAEGAEPVVAIDSRDAESYALGHIPGALSLPAAALESGAVSLPPREAGRLLIYANGARSREPLRVLRLALRAGREDARLILGGLQAWDRFAHATEIEPTALKHELDSASPPVLVDARPAEVSMQLTLPGAVRVPVEEMTWQGFTPEAWMPRMVFFAADARDPRAAVAAKRSLGWRYRADRRAYVPVQILRGGVEAWRAAGYATVPGAAAARSIYFDPKGRSREVPSQEFKKLRDGTRPPHVVLLDVRGPGSKSPAWATHIPLEELPMRLEEIDKGSEVITFCNFGNRARIAQVILERNGYLARYLHMAYPAVGN